MRHAPYRASQQVLAETELEDDGSFTECEIWELPDQTQLVSISGPYERGAEGGLPLFKLRWTIGGVQVLDTTPTWTLTANGETVESPVGVTVIPGPPPPDGEALGFVIVVKVAPGATHLQVEVAEADATKATPGTIGPLTLATGW